MTPGPDTTRSGLMPYLLLAFAALCWSGNHIMGRAIAGHVPPLAISTIRWAVPVLILLPFAIPHLRRDWPAIRAAWPMILFLGLTGVAVFGVLQYVGLLYTSATNMAVLNSFSPVMMAVAGTALFGDRLTWVQALGIFLSLEGVLLIVSKGRIEALQALAFNAGDLIILFNMGLWGIYSACLRKRPPIHWISFTFLLALISSVSTAPFFLAEHLAGDRLQPTLMTFASLAYACIFPSLVATILWNRGVAEIGPIRAGAMMHLIPIYGAVGAHLLLGETLEQFHLQGFVLILAGVWLAARR